jgi:hypothetical protein
VPLRLLRDEESPHRFTERQVGPYGTGGSDASTIDPTF